MVHQVDVVVLGAGASGLMLAAEAGKRGRSVVVLEKANKVGKKILMSGGGKCNFTNLDVEPSNYISENPHFVISALTRYTNWDFIGLVCNMVLNMKNVNTVSYLQSKAQKKSSNFYLQSAIKRDAFRFRPIAKYKA